MYTTTFISHGVTIHAVPEPDTVQVNTRDGIAWLVYEVQPNIQPRALNPEGNLVAKRITSHILHSNQIALGWAIAVALTPKPLTDYKHSNDYFTNPVKFNPKIHSASGKAVEGNAFASPIPLGRKYVPNAPSFPWPTDKRRVHHVEIGQKAGTVYWERNQWVVSRELTDGSRRFLMGSEWVYSPVWYPRSVAIRNLRSVIERDPLFAHGEA